MLSAIAHQMRHSQVLPEYQHRSAGAYAAQPTAFHAQDNPPVYISQGTMAQDVGMV